MWAYGDVNTETLHSIIKNLSQLISSHLIKSCRQVTYVCGGWKVGKGQSKNFFTLVNAGLESGFWLMGTGDYLLIILLCLS